MGDKKNNTTSFRDYFYEAKVREKSSTLKEYSERLLFEETVRNKLNILKDEGFSIQEGLIQITPWRKKLIGFEKPDFLVIKEDILFQLYLLIKEDAGIVKKEFLLGLSDVMQTNLKVTALILVWNYDNLPSCALDSLILRKYIEKPEENIDLSDVVISNLEQTIRNFYNDQFIDWSIPDDFLIEKEGEVITLNLTDILKKSIDMEFQALGEIAFKIPEKKEAQKVVLKLNKERILNKMTNLLSKPKLSKDDFNDFEKFLGNELKKANTEND